MNRTKEKIRKHEKIKENKEKPKISSQILYKEA